MEWIPIDKNCPGRGELPDYHVEVLISVNANNVYVAFLHNDSYSWFAPQMGILHIDDVDAWMMKPKPYVYEIKKG